LNVRSRGFSPRTRTFTRYLVSPLARTRFSIVATVGHAWELVSLACPWIIAVHDVVQIDQT